MSFGAFDMDGNIRMSSGVDYAASGFGFTARGKYRSQCSQPSFIHRLQGAGYVAIPINCGKCKHCRWVRVKTRSNQIAMELNDASWARFITLTIAPAMVTAALEDQILNMSLPQGFLKRLRINADRGKGSFLSRPEGAETLNIRFIECGEKGKKNGRCHYHFVIWGNGVPPDWASADRVHIPEWPFGHVNIKSEIDSGIGFYLSAYMQKNQDQDFISSQSSATALGSKYLARLAFALVDAGAVRPPDGFAVTIEEERGLRRAILRGAGRRDFVRAFALARGLTVLDFVPMVPEIMRPAIIAIDKWQRGRAEMIAYRDCISLVSAEKRMTEEFFAKYFGDVLPVAVDRSEPSKQLFRRRRLDLMVARMRGELSRGKRSVKDEKRSETSDQKIDRISGMVDRGDYVPRRLLPLPEPVRTYEMDRAARAKDRERQRAVYRAAFG